MQYRQVTVAGHSLTIMQVLDYLEENVRATPEALGDMHKETPEERAERHERVLASSLAAIRNLLGVLLPKEASAPRGAFCGPCRPCEDVQESFWTQKFTKESCTPYDILSEGMRAGICLHSFLQYASHRVVFWC